MQNVTNRGNTCFSFRLAVAFAQSTKARYQVENENVVGTTPTGDAQLHINDQWFYCLLKCDLYYRFDGILISIRSVFLWANIPWSQCRLAQRRHYCPEVGPTLGQCIYLHGIIFLCSASSKRSSLRQSITWINDDPVNSFINRSPGCNLLQWDARQLGWF